MDYKTLGFIGQSKMRVVSKWNSDDITNLSRKIIAQLHKENTAPLLQEISAEERTQLQIQIQKTNQRSILNTNQRSHSRNSLHADGGKPEVNDAAAEKINGSKKRLSMSEVSDMLLEFYKANVAKAPKNQQQLLLQNKCGQTSPTSAETHEPSSIAAIATNSAVVVSETASKNLQSDEMVSHAVATINSNINASFHPRIKYTNKSLGAANGTAMDVDEAKSEPPVITAIPTSVLVQTTPQIEPVDIKPIIHPTTGLVISPPSAVAASVIKPVPSVSIAAVPQAAVIAADLLRDGYHNFQQLLRAQEILKHQSNLGNNSNTSQPSTILENFLRQHHGNSECENESGNIGGADSDTSDAEYNEEDDSRFDDIHLVEGKTNNALGNNSLSSLFQAAASTSTSTPTADESQKFIMASQAQAQIAALRNLEYSLSEYGGSGGAEGLSPNSGADGEAVYECRHCGKKYRWKSTLRRHENVECGGKEPSHQCPYCPYKSKQRGNLGVHVRKHHSNLPQLASKRRSKYSVKLESGPNSANASDDSSSKLIIDCPK